MLKVNRVTAVSKNNSAAEGQFFKNEGGANTLVVVFPGKNYTCDMPLLYYAIDAALQLGCDVVSLKYFFQCSKNEYNNSEADRSQVSSDCTNMLKSNVLNTGSYKHIVFVSKSIGTMFAGDTALALGNESICHFFMTPLEDAIPYINKYPCAVVVGDSDDHFTKGSIAQIGGNPLSKLHVVNGANHSLETPGNSIKSIAILADVTKKWVEFLKTPPAAVQNSNNNLKDSQKYGNLSEAANVTPPPQKGQQNGQQSGQQKEQKKEEEKVVGEDGQVLTPQQLEEAILSYLYPKSIECPVCDKEFTDFIIRKSKLRAETVETDFMTHYKVINPNFYEILFCAHCGYATLQNYFDLITDRQKKMIREKVTPSHKPREFPAPFSLECVMFRYKQALICANAIEAKASQKAFINLKLAWIMRANKNKDLELRFLRDAFEGLKHAYGAERFPLGAMDETTAKYVIADLARRLGEMSEALRWVSDVVVARGIPSAIKDRAINMKDLIRDGITT